MFLQKYDFVEYSVPGRDLTCSDTLSRGQLKEQSPEISETSKLPSLLSHTELLHQHIKIKIGVETTNDNTLQSYVAQRWPRSRNQLNTGLKPYQNFRDELTVLNNLIFKGSKIIIPST